MKFCPECGAKLDKNFKFCPECGYKFGSDTTNSNQSKQSEPKGFNNGFTNGLRDESPGEYDDSKHGHSSKTCTVCGGRGQIKVINKTFLGEMVEVKTCKECGGTGKIITEFTDEN